MPYALHHMPYALRATLYALCCMPCIICPALYALYALYARHVPLVCPMTYDLCPMPYALCPMPYALCLYYMLLPYAICHIPYAFCFVFRSSRWSLLFLQRTSATPSLGMLQCVLTFHFLSRPSVPSFQVDQAHYTQAHFSVC